MGMTRGESPMAAIAGMQQMSRIMQALQQTDGQRSALRELHYRHREAQFERMARMMNQREDMHALIVADEPGPVGESGASSTRNLP